jgi:chromosome partitioning protein
MTYTISIFNQAGGVAKTTLAMNIGYELTRQGQRVLLIDLDPQGSLTIFLGINPWELQQCVYDVLMKDVPVSEVICETAIGVDLLPANRTLGMAEMELALAPMRERKLHQATDPIKANYDLILIDCPPSLGMLSYLALATSNSVLVPIECEFKSYYGTDLLLETVATVKQSGANPNLKILGFAPTKYSASKTQHQRVLAAIQSQLTQIAPVFEPIINAIAFVDASEQRLPLALYDRRHRALQPLQAMTKQILRTVAESEVAHVQK